MEFLESSMNYLCPDAAGKLLPTVLGVDLRGHRGHDLRDLQDEILLCQACFQNTQTFKPAHLHTSNKTPLYFQVKYFGRLGDTWSFRIILSIFTHPLLLLNNNSVLQLPKFIQQD